VGAIRSKKMVQPQRLLKVFVVTAALEGYW